MILLGTSPGLGKDQHFNIHFCLEIIVPVRNLGIPRARGRHKVLCSHTEHKPQYSEDSLKGEKYLSS